MGSHYSTARLRAGVLHFLVGKIGSAALTFTGFLLVARLLPAASYGRYVAMYAIIEIGLSMASLGLDWISTRYLPEYRVKAGGRGLVRFVGQLLGVQAMVLVLTGLLLALAAPWLCQALGLGDVTDVLRVYAAYLVVEGLAAVLRDQVLGQLLLQGRAQAALLLRHLVWVGALAWLWWSGTSGVLALIARIELAASAVGLAVSLVGLLRALRTSWQGAEPAAADWRAPDLAELRRLAISSYLAMLLNLPARAQTVTLLVTRLAGVEAAALYGFARSLSDQVLRFLPAELLLSFVRPVLVARFVQHGSLQQLNGQVNLLLTVSAIVLAPVLVLVWGSGGLLVQVLGSGRFNGAGLLLGLMLLGVVLFSQRRILEFVAYTVGQSPRVAQASLALLATPVLVFAALQGGAPVWVVPVIAIGLETLFGATVIGLLRRSGHAYAPPWRALVRVGAAVVIGSLALAAWPAAGSAGGVALAVHGVAALVLAAALMAVFKPLDRAAWTSLRALRPGAKGNS